MKKAVKKSDVVITIILVILSAAFIFPIALAVMNSFKTKFSIMGTPFALPDSDTFAGLENYIEGLKATGAGEAFLRSLFITVVSVVAMILLCSMTAWYIVRVRTWYTKLLYGLFMFSMIVPFQMVMYSMTNVAGALRLNNPLGVILLYVGFGSGLSVFILSGFARSIPQELEEAAEIDGCTPVRMFFQVVFPVMRLPAVTVAILDAMWVWNDFLLPYLILGSKYKTMPVAIQLTMQGAYGSINWGGFMAMIVLAVLPIVVFYLTCQKHIVGGVIAGAVKG